LRDYEPSKSVYENLIREGERVSTYKGEVSKGSVSRLQNACELMIAITPRKYYKHPVSGKNLSFRIGLLTCTLSSNQGRFTDREIKKQLLEPYLRKLRKYGLRNYVWKAERQKNGNVHFHIFIDVFIDRYDARNIWNRLQSKLGFIREFELKHGHADPNSTDLKAIHTDNSMIKYMLKYMIKPVDKGEQLEIGRDTENVSTGKVWDCSKALKEKNNTADFVSQTEFEQIENAIHEGNLKEIKKDYARIFIFNNPKPWKYIPESIYSRYKDYLNLVKSISTT
jgi:hypothetical protein